MSFRQKSLSCKVTHRLQVPGTVPQALGCFLEEISFTWCSGWSEDPGISAGVRDSHAERGGTGESRIPGGGAIVAANIRWA